MTDYGVFNNRTGAFIRHATQGEVLEAFRLVVRAEHNHISDTEHVLPCVGEEPKGGTHEEAYDWMVDDAHTWHREEEGIG